MNLAFGETSGDAKTTNVKHLLLGSVQNVPQSHSDNIFMGFIYGIAEARGGAWHKVSTFTLGTLRFLAPRGSSGTRSP